jgi:hypothetical protein
MKQDGLKRVVIPVEIKVRELYARLFLAIVLAERGYDVYIGNKIQHTAMGRINPHVYLETGAEHQSSRLRRCKNNGVKTLILETEGSAFAGSEWFSNKIDIDTVEHTDCYCAWGEVAAKAVRNKSPETRVEITGNPRFDLLQKPYREIYKNKSDELSNKHGDFILFNGSFGPPVENDEIFSELFVEFVNLIIKISNKYDRNIIVRPHPEGDVSLYKKLLSSHNNVYVTKQYEARPWIIASDVVIHNGCTTGVTAALLDTPVIGYTPKGMRETRLPNKISDKCSTISQVYESLDHYIENSNNKTADKKKKEIKKYIYNIDHLSSGRIADVVDSVVHNKTTSPSLAESKKLRIRQLLIRSLGSERFEQWVVKGIQGEDRYKFPYATTEEINSIIKRVSDEIKPSDLIINRVNYMVNGFRLRCE